LSAAQVHLLATLSHGRVLNHKP